MDLAKLFVINPIRVPSHGIKMVDSRMWDPNWRDKASWRATARIMRSTVVPSQTQFDLHRAQTIASQESYRWGRGSVPVATLARVVNMELEELVKPVRDALKRLRRGIPLLNDDPLRRPAPGIGQRSERLVLPPNINQMYNWVQQYVGN